MKSSKNSPPPPDRPGSAAPSRLTVGLGARAYDILIGKGLIARAGELVEPHLARQRVAIVTDETVAALHLPALEASLRERDIEPVAIVVPAGEATKSLDRVATVIDALLAADIERRDLILALGGGVVGDLAGFAAAVVHRGVRFVQIPTTLLAQVDSSVGGKTGVNTGHGKNLIGAFHQPVLVLTDTATLDTLPERERLAGYAELAKHGFLADRELFDWLGENLKEILAGGPLLVEAIGKSCAIKAAIVEEDEREGGRRALLNLGHTYGHALEAALAYSGEILHGEAVAIGCVLAFDLSARLGHCSPADARAVRDHLAAAGLPVSLVRLSNRLPATADLVALMGHDKKVVSGRKTLVLARAIGEAFLSREVSDEAIASVIEASRTP